MKHDGFRTLAHIDGHRRELRSRNGHMFEHWPQLCEEVAHAVKAHDTVIDGEIVCLDRCRPSQPFEITGGLSHAEHYSLEV